MQNASRVIYNVKQQLVELSVMLGSTNSGEIKCVGCKSIILSERYADVVIQRGRIWCSVMCITNWFSGGNTKRGN